MRKGHAVVRLLPSAEQIQSHMRSVIMNFFGMEAISFIWYRNLSCIKGQLILKGTDLAFFLFYFLFLQTEAIQDDLSMLHTESSVAFTAHGKYWKGGRDVDQFIACSVSCERHRECLASCAVSTERGRVYVKDAAVWIRNFGATCAAQKSVAPFFLLLAVGISSFIL